MKVERVSYDVMTPSAARGILEAIHWKPAIRWVIDEIQVMQPIAFSNIRRNEVSSIMKNPGSLMKTVSEKGSAEPFYQNTQKDRQQRATLMLKNVEYIIKAHFELTNKAGKDDTEEKHYSIFLRRARKGQCHHQPYFGCREFPVSFELVEEPLSKIPIDEDRDLGWMLYDINFSDKMTPKFFRAQMHKGVITIPESFHKEVNV
jgi:CRISPR-associated protein Cas5d